MLCESDTSMLSAIGNDESLVKREIHVTQDDEK